jgi:bacterioferritin
MAKLDTKKVVTVLNKILEAELAGVVRYTHYSFLVFGFSRIPIVEWLRSQAAESLAHAQLAGEWVTALGAHPSLAIGPLLEEHKHDIAAMLRESLESEGAALKLYRQLLELVEGKSIAIEEFARQMIHAEELHASEGLGRCIGTNTLGASGTETINQGVRHGRRRECKDAARCDAGYAVQAQGDGALLEDEHRKARHVVARSQRAQGTEAVRIDGRRSSQVPE